LGFCPGPNSPHQSLIIDCIAMESYIVAVGAIIIGGVHGIADCCTSVEDVVRILINARFSHWRKVQDDGVDQTSDGWMHGGASPWEPADHMATSDTLRHWTEALVQLQLQVISCCSSHVGLALTNLVIIVTRLTLLTRFSLQFAH